MRADCLEMRSSPQWGGVGWDRVGFFRVVVPPWVLHLLTDKLINSSSAQVLTHKHPSETDGWMGGKNHKAKLLQIWLRNPRFELPFRP